jgi:hypothetical protein
MPPFCPYSLTPGELLEVEVVQPDGGRSAAVGDVAAGGGAE